MRAITELARDLRNKSISSRGLVEEALARIDDPSGEGRRTFMTVWHERARNLADCIDAFELWRDHDSPLCGIPLSIKDLFDIGGEVTRAGSIARDDEPAAKVDAEAVWRLRAAGAILIGRVTMSEFAFSGIGLNHHFGTPRNPWDRKTGRIAGGSSSGSAISVADGMCAGSLASDTGGSIRAPAALCGLSGFKPTASRVSLKGAFPRSYSLDTAGPIAQSVSCCSILNRVLSETAPLNWGDVAMKPLKGLRLGVVEGQPLEGLDSEVALAFSVALSRLSQNGAQIITFPLPEIERIRLVTAGGGISPPEAFSIHRKLMAARPDLIDPIFLARLRKGGAVLAADYIDALRARREIMIDARRRTDGFDAILMPTCPIVAPAIAEVDTPERFEAMSALILRNCNLANFLDRPALTIPINPAGSAPVGLMLMGEHDDDETLLEVGATIEACLKEPML